MTEKSSTKVLFFGLLAVVTLFFIASCNALFAGGLESSPTPIPTASPTMDHGGTGLIAGRVW